MTEPRDDAAAALPLAVTYAPDNRLVAAAQALVQRVGAATGAPERAQRFAAAVQHVVAWVTSHRGDVDGDLTMRFDREGDRLRGDLSWTASGTPMSPPLEPADGVDVDVDVDGSRVRCRISCPCA